MDDPTLQETPQAMQIWGPPRAERRRCLCSGGLLEALASLSPSSTTASEAGRSSIRSRRWTPKWRAGVPCRPGEVTRTPRRTRLLAPAPRAYPVGRSGRLSRRQNSTWTAGGNSRQQKRGAVTMGYG
jgi:hypothetical protein